MWFTACRAVRRQSWWKSLSSVVVKRVISWSMGLKAVRDLSAFKTLPGGPAGDLRQAINGREVPSTCSFPG